MISTTDYSFLEKRFSEVPIGSIPEDYKNSPKTNLDELSDIWHNMPKKSHTCSFD